MKRLIHLLLILPALALADARMVLEYERARTVEFEMYNADGTLDVDEVDGGAEVTIHCNGDAGTTATNDFVDEGSYYSLALTAAELACGRVTLSIGATLTHNVFIETCGSPNAQHMLCPGGIYTTGGTSASASNTTTTTILDTSLAFADDDLNDFLICFVEDFTANDPKECRIITDYTGASDTATHQAFPAALSQNGEYIILPGPMTVVNATNGVVDANTVTIEGSDATDQINAAADTALTDYDAATGTELATHDAKLDTVDDYVDTEVAAILADTGTDGVVLANDAITAAKIAADAIGASEIATDAIGAAEIAADAIGASEIATDAIGAAEIAADAIGASELATDAIGSAELAATAATEISNSTREDFGALRCEVNVGNNTNNTTSVPCLVTDPAGNAWSGANDALNNKRINLITVATPAPYQGDFSFISDTTWDAVNSELVLTISPALSGALEDGDVVEIVP